MQTIVLLVLAVLVAFLVFLLVRKPEVGSAEALAALNEALGQKNSEIAVFHERLAGEARSLEDSNRQIREISGERESLRDALGKSRQELAEILGRIAAEQEAKVVFKAEFAHAAAEVLRSNGETFLNLAESKLRRIQSDSTGELNTKKAEIEGLITPMAASLSNLTESVRSLRQSEEGLLAETRQLATALKETKKRGNWGELQLKRIAELSGMQERCDFSLQNAVTTDENRRLFPDMIVRLPNNRVIVVDSKASMTAYGESANSTDPGIQQQKLIEHAKAVRKRIDELADKEYRSHVEGSADFVVCFIPGEAFFSGAVAADGDLLEYAASRSVVLASPTTLLAILRAVALGWKEAKLANEAKEICRLASDLYERFRKSAEHVERVGSGLSGAINSYNAFIGSVESRVFPQARKLQKLAEIEKDVPELKTIELSTRPIVSPDWLVNVEVLSTLVAGSDETLQDESDPISRP
ncbi:MAG TPA: DNA recombination protein RmuC [Acidobacteriaceae bacterium]